MIVIVLSLPPSTNKLWAPVRTKTGARIVSRTVYADWKAQAKREVEAQREGKCIGGCFRASILIPEGAYDADNIIKPTLDACQAGRAIKNDKYCMGGTWDVDDTRAGTVRIELIPIPPIAPAPRRTKGIARQEPIS
jgi:Holliday junction resolvase RusA-like endonuclease